MKAKSGIFPTKLIAFTLAVWSAGLLFSVFAFAQEPGPVPTPASVRLSSETFIQQGGADVERLIRLGSDRRGDLLAARQRLVIAQGRLVQAGARPNPTLEAEYGSARFLGGEAESEVSVGVSQTFELGGKRSRRAAVAELELQQARAEVLALERQIAAEIRAAFTNVLGAARQLDVLEKLIAAGEEVVRLSEARLAEGDAAPLEVNLVRVETERLKVQAIEARSDLETQLLQLKTLVGADVGEPLPLAPQPERPPRLDLRLSDLTKMALAERADLQAARIGERLGLARLDLARANAVPDVSASVRYSRSKGITDLPPAVGGPIRDTENELTFGVSIDIPVFNRNQGEIAAAAGEQTQAARQREFLESAIKRDVAIAYRKYRAAAEALVIYSTQILPRAEANLQSVRAAYGYGEFSVFDVVNEQRRLLENITGYNQSLRSYYAALAELEAALGTTIPAAGFAPSSESVLPDRELVPNQVERERFLKSIETVELKRRNSFTGSELKKEQ